MDSVLITKDGLLDDDGYTVPPFEILKYLQRSVTLDGDLTLRQLLIFFNNYPDLHHVFTELTELCKYRHTFHNSIDHVGNTLYIDYSIQMSWSSYTVKNMVPADEQDENSSYVKMEFVYDNEKEHMSQQSYYSMLLHDPDADESRYAITFTPIEELLNLPVKLGNEVLTMMVERDKPKMRTNELICIDLYDLIVAVLDDVMFFGDEDTKKNRFDDLMESVKELTNDTEDDDNDCD